MNPGPIPIYYGEFPHSMDVKNRITLPSKWRREEPEDFYIFAQSDNECLIIAPQEEFENIGNSVANNPKYSDAMKSKFRRTFYPSARMATLDRQGRLLIPDELCRKVNLGTDVLLVGEKTRVEVWNSAEWIPRNAADRLDSSPIYKDMLL